MQKKLRFKLFTLFALCAALMTISHPPAASANTRGPSTGIVYCQPAPVDAGCASGWFCCLEYDQECSCA
jgi:hypothetical protein